MKKIQDQVPQLHGLKHSSKIFPNVRVFNKMGLDCLIGNHQLMLPALTIGATGCVDGPPIIAPEYWVNIWKTYKNGDIKGMELAQDKASQFWANLAECGGEFHSVAKAALSERLSINCGAARPPGQPLTSSQKNKLREIMINLELL